MMQNLFGGEAPREEIYIGAVNKETGIVEGFYVEGIHGKEKIEEILNNGGVPLNVELWQELLSYGQAIVDVDALAAVPVATPENGQFCYTMEHSKCFSKYEAPQVYSEPVPTEMDLVKERVEGLETKLNKILELLDK